MYDNISFDDLYKLTAIDDTDPLISQKYQTFGIDKDFVVVGRNLSDLRQGADDAAVKLFDLKPVIDLSLCHPTQAVSACITNRDTVNQKRVVACLIMARLLSNPKYFLGDMFVTFCPEVPDNQWAPICAVQSEIIEELSISVQPEIGYEGSAEAAPRHPTIVVMCSHEDDPESPTVGIVIQYPKYKDLDDAAFRTILAKISSHIDYCTYQLSRRSRMAV